jgi:1,4-dihydroxy-2-naphthoate octaprenyltransferase
VVAARLPTLTAAVTPVVVGTAAAARAGGVHPLPAIAALIVAVCIQVGTNFSNDAFDFLRGADTPDRRGPTRATQSGLLSPRQVLTGAYLCFALAGLAGGYFVVLYGWPVLAAGLLAIASGLGYTGGPWPIAYHGLGEVFVFAFFGVMAVVGSAYVQVGRLIPLAVAASVPVGLLATAILILNNLRDIETDGAAGKRTLPVRVGASATRALYLVCLIGAGVAPAALRGAGLVGRGFWLPWLALPPMLALARTALGSRDAPALNRALAQTARLHLLFGSLLAASFLW